MSDPPTDDRDSHSESCQAFQRAANAPAMRQLMLKALHGMDRAEILLGFAEFWKDPEGAVLAASVISEHRDQFDDNIVADALKLLEMHELSTEPGAPITHIQQIAFMVVLGEEGQPVTDLDVAAAVEQLRQLPGIRAVGSPIMQPHRHN